MSASIALACVGCAFVAQPESVPYVRAETAEEAGRYLVLIGGCNDCHTPGWDRSKGNLPTSAWLTGNDLGYLGDWGTSYAPNLRLSVARLTEDQWVQLFRAGAGLPPMPWMNYTAMHDDDLKAMYRFIRNLGPKGEPAPAAVPPGQEPKTPYLLFVPQQPGGRAP